MYNHSKNATKKTRDLTFSIKSRHTLVRGHEDQDVSPSPLQLHAPLVALMPDQASRLVDNVARSSVEKKQTKHHHKKTVNVTTFIQASMRQFLLYNCFKILLQLILSTTFSLGHAYN